MTKSNRSTPPERTVDATNGTCPVCRAQSAYTYRPFCSKRCADLDLAQWLREGYAIPGRHADPDELQQAEIESRKADDFPGQKH